MLEFLREPLVWVMGGQTYSLASPTRRDLDKCFQHVRAWLRLAVQTVRAEFPSFNYWAAFKVFNGKASEMNNLHMGQHCKRLATLAGVSPDAVATELLQLEPLVNSHQQRV
eukprot:5493856-Pyramimonas_sp.AAC.1